MPIATFSFIRLGRSPSPARRGGIFVWLVALLLLIFGSVGYLFSVQENPVTGERQRVAMSPDEEMMLGQQSVAEMAAQMGGVFREGSQPDAVVDQVGDRLIEVLNQWVDESGRENPYEFEFHVAADEQMVNAMALPGGQIFITRGLLNRMNRVDQIAAVLSHEIGHVIHRHASQRMAKAKFKASAAAALQTATGAETTGVAAIISQMMDLRYGRQQELESDVYAVELMRDAGYDPKAMIELLDILESASDGSPPEFLSTHPHPESRREKIRDLLAAKRTS